MSATEQAYWSGEFTDAELDAIADASDNLPKLIGKMPGPLGITFHVFDDGPVDPVIEDAYKYWFEGAGAS